ncbi:hypothetical protein G7046_g982 [Stylonectria norvegica]|nr:hypothetical protein G7046_g982 [Stylonectria norvegica]
MPPFLSTYAVYSAILIAGTLGHMEMIYPPPFKSKFNPNAGTDIDYDLMRPLDPTGADFPCKGYDKYLNTDAGIPVATLTAGESTNITITGGAIHNGGSCQVSLSVDEGYSFYVLHTYIGGCPASVGDNSYSFNVPANVPDRQRAILGWTWFNNVGNREMYMNCASVETVGVHGEAKAFKSRPLLFKANIGNGCDTVEGKDVLIPNPGPDSTVNSKGTSSSFEPRVLGSFIPESRILRPSFSQCCTLKYSSFELRNYGPRGVKLCRLKPNSFGFSSLFFHGLDIYGFDSFNPDCSNRKFRCFKSHDPYGYESGRFHFGGLEFYGIKLYYSRFLDLEPVNYTVSDLRLAGFEFDGSRRETSKPLSSCGYGDCCDSTLGVSTTPASSLSIPTAPSPGFSTVVSSPAIFDLTPTSTASGDLVKVAPTSTASSPASTVSASTNPDAMSSEATSTTSPSSSPTADGAGCDAYTRSQFLTITW